jgi:RNA polymerase sigma factor (TIGR02999 family)
MQRIRHDVDVNTLTEEEICTRIEGAMSARGADLAQLIVGLQNELRQIAHRQRRRAIASETLSTTALVNEAYIKFSSAPELFAQIDRQHFLAIAARAMRNIAINHARDKLAQKRGSGLAPETLDAAEHSAADLNDATQILELNDALERLEKIRPRLAQVVQLRYFAGLSEAETGAVLGLDPSTVRRDWLKARGWLYDKLNPDNGP